MDQKNHLHIISILVFLMVSCSVMPDGTFHDANRQPTLQPNNIDVTIPVNIAPLNFFIQEKGSRYFVEAAGKTGNSIKVASKNGIIRFPQKKWKSLLRQNASDTITYTVFAKEGKTWIRYSSYRQFVSSEPIDKFLYYRLLHPGFESWKEISIVQRHLETFQERTVVKNNVLEQNCVNCHTFNSQNKSDFLFHVRGSRGGTYFLNGDNLEKINLKTDAMQNGAVYSRWHPSGRFVAFSSNKVVQQFHASDLKKIEVSDLNSSLILYDWEKNEMMDVPMEQKHLFMDTYPEWSPDGKALYFCRTNQIEKEYDYREIRYDLCRVSFDPANRTFGKVETVYKASMDNKSVSFPRIAPDGKSLVFTLHNYGCFPIWHKEADLYSVDLSDLSIKKLPVNSEFTESYHSWSSNGRWLVFSSKREDGLSARPYIAFVSSNGKVGKPFVLPQDDPRFYSRFVKTFNLPELSNAAVSFTPGQLRRASERSPKQVNQAKQ